MSKRLNITLNDTLYHQIKERSTKELRSVSNMIEFVLTEYVKGPDVFLTPETTHSPIPETSYKIAAKVPTKMNIIEEEDDEDGGEE